MNVHKHMEAIFVTTLAVVGVGSFVLDSLPEAEARPAPVARVVERNLATPHSMAVVVVRGHKAPGRA